MPIFKITYLPPLLIYASAGVSGLTSIVGIFFIKDYLMNIKSKGRFF